MLLGYPWTGAAYVEAIDLRFKAGPFNSWHKPRIFGCDGYGVRGNAIVPFR